MLIKCMVMLVQNTFLNNRDFHALLNGTDGKESGCKVGDLGLIPGWRREKRMVTHPSIIAWRIPRTEEPGELQSLG